MVRITSGLCSVPRCVAPGLHCWRNKVGRGLQAGSLAVGALAAKSYMVSVVRAAKGGLSSGPSFPRLGRRARLMGWSARGETRNRLNSSIPQIRSLASTRHILPRHERAETWHGHKGYNNDCPCVLLTLWRRIHRMVRASRGEHMPVQVYPLPAV